MKEWDPLGMEIWIIVLFVANQQPSYIHNGKEVKIPFWAGEGGGNEGSKSNSCYIHLSPSHWFQQDMQALRLSSMWIILSFLLLWIWQKKRSCHSPSFRKGHEKLWGLSVAPIHAPRETGIYINPPLSEPLAVYWKDFLGYLGSHHLLASQGKWVTAQTEQLK